MGERGDETYPNIGGLNLAARGLLLALLYCGPNVRPIEIMSIAGISKKKTLHDARKELEAAGFIAVDRIPGKQPMIRLLKPLHPFLSTAECSLTDSLTPKVDPLDDRCNVSKLVLSKYLETARTGLSSGLEDEVATPKVATLRVVGTPEVATLRVPTTLKGATPRVATQTGDSLESSYPESTHPKVLLERCIEVDDMDSTGSPQQRNSPFQQRRKAQLPLVQEVWLKFFPYGGELSDVAKKDLLRLCDDSLETLHEELENAAQAAAKTLKKSGKTELEGPITYVKKVLTSRKAERNEKPAEPTLQRPTELAPVSEPGLEEPSPELLQRLREANERFNKWREQEGLPE